MKFGTNMCWGWTYNQVPSQRLSETSINQEILENLIFSWKQLQGKTSSRLESFPRQKNFTNNRIIVVILILGSIMLKHQISHYFHQHLNFAMGNGPSAHETIFRVFTLHVLSGVSYKCNLLHFESSFQGYPTCISFLHMAYGEHWTEESMLKDMMQTEAEK